MSERTRAHDGDSHARGWSEALVWRPPEAPEIRSHGLQSSTQPFRTCGYCGSIHPLDLIGYVDNPDVTIRLQHTDWKYGWPHKFYVQGIPNPLAGQQVPSSSRSIGTRPRLDMLPWDSRVLLAQSTEREATDEELFDAGWHIEIEETIRRMRTRDGEKEIRRHQRESFHQQRLGAAPAEAHAKLYSIHLIDLADDEKRDERFQAINALTYPITFWLENDVLHYLTVPKKKASR